MGPSMPRLLLALLLLASIVLGALGAYVSLGFDPAAHPVSPEVAAPPRPIAAPPLGARPRARALNTLHEARRDGVVGLLAGLLLVTSLVHLVTPGARRRIRSSVLLRLAYLLLLPVCGLLSAGVHLEAYGWARALATFCAALSATNLAAARQEAATLRQLTRFFGLTE